MMAGRSNQSHVDAVTWDVTGVWMVFRYIERNLF